MRKNHLLYVVCVLVLIGLICVLPAAATATGKIAFSSRQDGKPGIYVINPDGNGLVRLTTNNTEIYSEPTWSPDGSRIAFTLRQDGISRQGIAVMNADGTNLIRLTPDDRYFDTSPVWSPDGSRIAFLTGLYGDKYTRKTAVINADGTNLIQLTTDSFLDGIPVWSPDGSWIAFDSYRYGKMPDGSQQVYVIKPDGTGLTRLTAFTEKAVQPVWSPDGSRIAFKSYQNGTNEIYEINRDGTGRTRLTNNTYYYPGRVWSPDHSQFAFTVQTESDYYPALYVMNADGTGQTHLTDNAYNPAWGVGTTSPPIALRAAFIASTTSGTAPLTIFFTDQSTGAPTSYAWKFGDGTTSSAKNPTHRYTTPGTYTVIEIIRNSAGGSDSTRKTVTVTAPPVALKAGFTASATSGKAPLTVLFTDQSAGTPTSYAWKFGDGTTSSAKNPTHRYKTAGTYTVTEIIRNSAGSNTLVKKGYITVR